MQSIAAGHVAADEEFDILDGGDWGSLIGVVGLAAEIDTVGEVIRVEGVGVDEDRTGVGDFAQLLNGQLRKGTSINRPIMRLMTQKKQQILTFD